MTKLPDGLYDLLHTARLQAQLESSDLLDRSKWEAIDQDQLRYLLAIQLARDISGYIGESVSGVKPEKVKEELDKMIQSPEGLYSVIQALQPVSQRRLRQVLPEFSRVVSDIEPDTPLSVSALLTGSSRSPSLRSQLMKELANCDRADWLVSFIKYSGVLPLLPILEQFTQTSSPDGGPRLRIATTSYMGATDFKAIKALLELPNTEVRISYDTKRTRLHAKAYMFIRKSGFGSAYIGSANVSKAALDEGLEWTAKISQYETNHLWQHAVATFDSHWEDDTEFTPCTKQGLPKLANALSREREGIQSSGDVSFFDLRPFGFQQAILEDIYSERLSGKHKHLVIAATGTGKTMIAAFDYLRFCGEAGVRPSLLFVAHRKEILAQARSAFRQVLRDGNFGELVAGGSQLTQSDHLFCTVQSWNSRNFQEFNPDHFAYVVLDEAHHASARSYQKLIEHIQPQSLLGLTATPERSDGADIRLDFGGAFTHEIRLAEAVERALLSPFHYFGVPDLDGLDFSSVTWKKGRYDVSELGAVLEQNRSRARWVMGQAEQHVSDMKGVRGLGFCVSIKHAEFMAQYCNEHSIAAIALTGDTPPIERSEAQQKLESGKISFIFTVNLYNEGVDIPSVNTVLFLRPTESLTIFLQQLGRGLRLHPDKSHLQVLDFIAPQHRHFNFTHRFQALSSRPELRVDKQLESDMPYVPSGCFIHLEKQAKETVLENIRSITSSMRGAKLLQELRRLNSEIKGDISLSDMIDFLHLDSPDEIYRKGLPHVLISKSENPDYIDDLEGFSKPLASGFRRIASMDDTILMEEMKSYITDKIPGTSLIESLMHSVVWGNNKPGDGTLQEARAFFLSRPGLKRDLIELLEWLLRSKTPILNNPISDLTGPLNLHASYTREQIILSLGLGSFENPRPSREGVLHVPERKVDAFFADINKSEADYSPTTMYEDYAMTRDLFHWQSQSQTSETSRVGQRYIRHIEKGYTPILFIRDRNKLANGLTAPYVYAGPLSYHKHSGNKPISFVWKLKYPLPAKVMVWAGRAG